MFRLNPVAPSGRGQPTSPEQLALPVCLVLGVRKIKSGGRVLSKEPYLGVGLLPGHLSSTESLSASPRPLYWPYGRVGAWPCSRKNSKKGQNLGPPSPSKQCVHFSARLKFEFHLHYSPVMWSRARSFTSLGLSFLICVMGMIHLRCVTRVGLIRGNHEPDSFTSSFLRAPLLTGPDLI